MIVWMTFCFLCFFSLSFASGDVDTKSWYQKMIDPTMECPPVDKSTDYGPLIWQAVDCETPGSRYDYIFKSDKSGSKGVRVFNGKGHVTFGSLHQQEGFNHGLKYGKCILPFHPSVKQLAGRFKNDRLEGSVRVTFQDGSFAIAFARNNYFTGIMRNFNHIKEFQNITETSTGKLLLARSFNAYVNPISTKPGCLLVTLDFDDFFECSSLDLIHFHDCHQLEMKEKLSAFPETCEVFLALEDSKMKSSGRLDLNFNWSSKLKGPISLREECPKEKEWNYQNIRKSIEQWRNNFFLNDDFLWTHKRIDEPLDLFNPRIFITFNDLVNRKFLSLKSKVTFRSGSKYLFETEMVNGTIDSVVPQDIAKLPHWKGPVIIGIRINQSVKLNRESINPFEAFDYVVFGHLKHGKLDGLVTINGIVPTDPEYYCPNYVGEGLGFIGNYKDGIPFGICWREVIGGSWIYGEVDENGHFTGDNIAYVYQDLKTALVGRFEKGLMVSGQEAEVIGEKCAENGIKLLQFTQPSGPAYHYKPASADSFGDQPLLGDPLDKRYVFVKISQTLPLAGEGAHAKVDIPPFTTYMNYGGHLLTHSQLEKFNYDATMKFAKMNLTRSSDEVTDFSKFRQRVKSCDLIVDIPPEFEPTSKYCGTIGHKINHSFLPNSQYTNIENPRFGIIAALKSGEKTIHAGEEFFVTYGYSFLSAPLWYKKLFLDFIEEHPQEKHVIDSTAQDIPLDKLKAVLEAAIVGIPIKVKSIKMDSLNKAK